MCDKPLCWVCGEKPVFCKERCVRCYSYHRDHGIERPKGLEKALKIPKLCSNCQRKIAVKKGRCLACRSYFQRHGTERPMQYLAKLAERVAAPRWCKNCGSPEVSCNLRCARCDGYWRIHKKERPYHLHTDDPRCKTCGKPLPNGSRRKLSGRCDHCREYRRVYKKERPQKLWGNGPHGFCECGQPANHLIDKFPLCDGCAVEYQKGAYS